MAQQMAIFDVQVEGGVVVRFQADKPASEVLDALTKHPDVRTTGVLDKAGVTLVGNDMLTADGGPYVFRRSCGCLGGGLH